MTTPPSSSLPVSLTYTPGYRTAKQIMVLGGLVLFLWGVAEIWRPLRLLVVGQRAQAEVVRVVKEKEGLAPQVLTEVLELQAQLEPRDRSYTFWNEFRFPTREGRWVEVRAHVGSQLRPLYPLTDANGLPTADVVYYHPADPTDAIFPLIISTWLTAGLLIGFGAGTAIIGGYLLHWSNQPIELPQIPPEGVAVGPVTRRSPR